MAVIISKYKRAERPFDIETMGIHIYSMEELVWFLHENISLVDRKIIGPALFDWIGDEIGNGTLRDRLKAGMEAGSSLPNLIITIFRDVEFYTKEEQNELLERMRLLTTYSEQERCKLRADEYFANGNYQSAIREYTKILEIRQSSRLEVDFYAHVWNNLGVCYTKLFLFRKAASAFRNAYQFSRDPEIFDSYVYAQRFCMSDENFEEAMELQHVRGTQLQDLMDRLDALREEAKKESESFDEPKTRLFELKKEYRRNMTHS